MLLMAWSALKELKTLRLKSVGYSNNSNINLVNERQLAVLHVELTHLLYKEQPELKIDTNEESFIISFKDFGGFTEDEKKFFIQHKMNLLELDLEGNTDITHRQLKQLLKSGKYKGDYIYYDKINQIIEQRKERGYATDIVEGYAWTKCPFIQGGAVDSIACVNCPYNKDSECVAESCLALDDEDKFKTQEELIADKEDWAESYFENVDVLGECKIKYHKVNYDFSQKPMFTRETYFSYDNTGVLTVCNDRKVYHSNKDEWVRCPVCGAMMYMMRGVYLGNNRPVARMICSNKFNKTCCEEIEVTVRTDANGRRLYGERYSKKKYVTREKISYARR